MNLVRAGVWSSFRPCGKRRQDAALQKKDRNATAPGYRCTLRPPIPVHFDFSAESPGNFDKFGK